MERRKAITRQDRNVCYGAETFSAFAEYEDNFVRTKTRLFFIVLAGRNIFTFLCCCHVGNTNEIILSNVLSFTGQNLCIFVEFDFPLSFQLFNDYIK